MTTHDPDPPIQYDLTEATDSEQTDELQDLGELYESVSSFIALFTEATDGGEELPDELDSDTKRKLRTAHTYLENIEADILESARKRRDGAVSQDETEDSDDNGDVS